MYLSQPPHLPPLPSSSFTTPAINRRVTFRISMVLLQVSSCCLLQGQALGFCDTTVVTMLYKYIKLNCNTQLTTVCFPIRANVPCPSRQVSCLSPASFEPLEGKKPPREFCALWKRGNSIFVAVKCDRITRNCFTDHNCENAVKDQSLIQVLKQSLLFALL